MGTFEVAKENKITLSDLIMDRGISILDFQKRILDIAKLDETPPMEKLNFLKIIRSNLNEFLSIRMPPTTSRWCNTYLHYIDNIFHQMDDVFNAVYPELYRASNVKVNNLNNMELSISQIKSGIVYVGYLIDSEKWVIQPYNELLNDPVGYKHKFLFQIIEDQSMIYNNNGDSIKKQLKNIDKVDKSKNNKIFHYVLTTANAETIIPILNNFSINVQDVIYVTESILTIKDLVHQLEYHDKINYNDSHKYIPDKYYYENRNYINPYIGKSIIEELNKRKNILMRCPFESYEEITQFIEECCINENIHNIFITLYRTANDSKIVQSLMKAAKLKKNVFVYVETMARGDEAKNMALVKKLKAAGVHVQDYFNGFKIHAKLFLAIESSPYHTKTYAHIGTGNYNENTANLYTDTHIMTTDSITAYSILNIFQMIFGQNNQKLKASHTVFLSPFNSREEIVNAMEKEIKKKDKGIIRIKCNSLCDPLMINMLHVADSAGVDVKLLVRTGLSILPSNHIQIRSKVGRYLEHDRIYIIGDNVYIGSADLLFRNLDKRIECLYKVSDQREKSQLNYVFNNLWLSDHIHVLNPETLTWDLT